MSACSNKTQSERKGKKKKHTQPRLLLGVAKYKEYTNQHAYSWALRSTKSPRNHEVLNGNKNKESHKTTRLLLGVAKYKEYTNQHIDSMCHECIKTTRLFLGVAKNKES